MEILSFTARFLGHINIGKQRNIRSSFSYDLTSVLGDTFTKGMEIVVIAHSRLDVRDHDNQESVNRDILIIDEFLDATTAKALSDLQHEQNHKYQLDLDAQEFFQHAITAYIKIIDESPSYKSIPFLLQKDTTYSLTSASNSNIAVRDQQIGLWNGQPFCKVDGMVDLWQSRLGPEVEIQLRRESERVHKQSFISKLARKFLQPLTTGIISKDVKLVPAPIQPDRSVDAMCGYYLMTCEVMRIPKISLRDLEHFTKISKSKWSRHLLSSAFALRLRERIQKKINYAKIETWKNFWMEVRTEMDSLISKISNRLYEQRKSKKDVEKLPSHYSFDQYSDKSEDVGRGHNNEADGDEEDKDFVE